ncbi:MAG: nucleotidyltransferase domain-containing protein [Muribaculaceae bacterium]|nr:nucleotidyltransferase domain-containing protein [Muribaculaceae bacterium]
MSASESYLKSEFGVKSLLLFGSMARGDNRIDSDVDVCVDMPPKAFKVVGLKLYLQELLGAAVDVVRLNPRLDSFLINEIRRDGITVF